MVELTNEEKIRFSKTWLGKTYVGKKVISDKKVKFKRTSQPSLNVAPMYSKEQAFMRGFFGHGDKVIFGSKDSESLPQMNGALMPYEHGDDLESGTAESFGLGSIKRRTGLY